MTEQILGAFIAGILLMGAMLVIGGCLYVLAVVICIAIRRARRRDHDV